MFFVGIFSSQIATILVYLGIFLYFTMSLASGEIPENIEFSNSIEKHIDFQQKNTVEYFSIFSFHNEKQNLKSNNSVCRLDDFKFCKLEYNFHKQILESELINSFHAENTIFNRPPPYSNQ